MGFFNDIKHQYGSATVGLLKTMAKIYIKQASMQNRRVFLLECRRQKLLPNHITHGTSNINSMLSYTHGQLGRRIQNFNCRLGNDILNLEIRVTFCELTSLKKQLLSITDQLSNLLPQYILNEYIARQQTRSNYLSNKIKRKNLNKLNLLQSKMSNNIKTKDSWFKNLTDIDIPQDITSLLALGPKFSLNPPANEIKISHLLADLENIINNIDNSQKDSYRAQYTNIITNFMHKNHNDKPFLNSLFKKAKLFFKDHPDLYIVRSDKGNVTVAMYKMDYINKSQELLNDQEYYIRLNRNPTYTLELKANKIVKSLKEKGHITDVQARSMTSYNTIAPRFYSLPKIHKPALAMRPIVSCINSPNGQLAQFLTSVLTNAYDTDNDFYIKSSFSFSTFINNYQLPNNYVIVSFDVVSLFTNLPLDAIIDSLRNRWDTISDFCTLDFDTFEHILNFIFDSNYLCFNGSYYKQIFGTPMGSTISPILVNFVLDDLVKDCLQFMPFYVPFVKRYVDDLILALPRQGIETALELFNTYNRHIQFTVEMEQNNSVPFLDMLVIRTHDNVLKTKWYRKPYCSNRFISYFSYHPIKTKINLILGMKNRAVKLTHPSFRKEALELLRVISLDNSYPVSLINKLLFSTQYEISENIVERIPQQLTLSTQGAGVSGRSVTHETINNRSFIRYFSLPHIEGLTDKLCTVFKHIDIKIARKQTRPLSLIFSKTKMPLAKLENYNIVYKIPCGGCNLSYIGQTSRSLKGRITSHKSDCTTGKLTSALAEHFVQWGHNFDWGSAEILEKVNEYHKRTFLEMVHINRESPNMNKKSDTQNLSTIYSYILKLERERYISLLDAPAPDE